MSTPIGEIKPALYSVTYMGHWYRGDALSLEELIERARRFGFEGIEIEARRPHGCPLDWPTDRCRDLRRRAADAGLAITAVGALNDFSSPVAEQREAQLAAVRDLVRMTSDLDAGILRVFLGWTGSTRAAEGGARYDIAQKAWDAAHEDFAEQEIWGFCRDALVEAARFAGEHGVVLALQNHRPILRTYRQLLQMVREVGSPHLKVCLDAPLMLDKSPASMHQAAQEVGPLQVMSHFGGEFERLADGGIRGYERKDGVAGAETNQYYREFIHAMREIGYEGYISYELCHPLPVMDGQTVGIEFANRNAQLAAEFMRQILNS